MHPNRSLKPLLPAVIFIALAIALSMTACQQPGGDGAHLSSANKTGKPNAPSPQTPQNPSNPQERTATPPASLNIEKLVPSGNEKLISTPKDLHQPIISAIQQAQKSLDIVNFHLSDPDVVTALKEAAGRGVTVRLLLDQSILSKSTTGTAIFDELKKSGVLAKKSTSQFSITHQKSLVIDRELEEKRTAFITTMNLITVPGITRDYGLITQDKEIINEMTIVFEVDWTNADKNTKETPILAEERLLWSPVNSKPKILGLINLAQKNIDIEVENFGDDEVIAALGARISQVPGLKIRTITPGCSAGGDPLYSRPFLERLKKLGVENRVMAAEPDENHPFMHAKMMVVDNQIFYLGSENLSFNSLTKARELGILTNNAELAQQLESNFSLDWTSAFAPESVTKAMCAAATGPYSGKPQKPISPAPKTPTAGANTPAADNSAAAAEISEL